MFAAEFQLWIPPGPTQPCVLQDRSISPLQALRWSLSQVRGTAILPSTPQCPELNIAASISFRRKEGGWKEAAFCPALEDAKSEQSWGRHGRREEEKGKSVKLLLVLSVAIAASQCPRDI